MFGLFLRPSPSVGGNAEVTCEGDSVELRHFSEHCGRVARERSRFRPPCRDESDEFAQERIASLYDVLYRRDWIVGGAETDSPD